MRTVGPIPEAIFDRHASLLQEASLHGKGWKESAPSGHSRGLTEDIHSAKIDSLRAHAAPMSLLSLVWKKGGRQMFSVAANVLQRFAGRFARGELRRTRSSVSLIKEVQLSTAAGTRGCSTFQPPRLVLEELHRAPLLQLLATSFYSLHQVKLGRKEGNF